MKNLSNVCPAAILTRYGSNLGIFAGMTSGKNRQYASGLVGKFSVVPKLDALTGHTWGIWGKPAQYRTCDDVAKRNAIHNPHALLTLLPNIYLSIYKGLP